MPRTPRERIIHALERQPPVAGEQVPHFELVFYLTMEAFGKVHPSHRSFWQWDQMSAAERRLHRQDVAQLYVDIARRYGQSAIFVQPFVRDDQMDPLAEAIRDISGDEFLLVQHGDATFGVPDGNHMEDFAVRMAEDPGGLRAEAARSADWAVERGQRFAKAGLFDGFALCSDYAFNVNPFMSPAQFADFVTPYLAKITQAYRDQGLYVIKHTDGNINPILDQLAQTKPHALHSLDPQGGMDIAEVKRQYGREMCLIGNVNCGLIDTGTEEEMLESARYALRHGMPGGGYVFSTSNCVYTGMKLSRYDQLLECLRKEGVY